MNLLHQIIENNDKEVILNKLKICTIFSKFEIDKIKQI